MPRTGGPTPPTRTRTEIVLRVTAGPQAGEERVLQPGETLSIGRSEDADLSLADSKISRLHCRVESVDGDWIVRDLDSRNGTWVGTRRVKVHTLSDGETFEVGRSVPVNVRIRETAPAPRGRRAVFPPKSDAEPAPAPVPAPEEAPPLEGPFVGLPGTQLGEVRIVEPVRPLGRAVFFRALQPSLNRHVMVEVFLDAEISRAGGREALQRGVQRAAPLLHPNVLQIFDYGSARGFTYVTMELFQGRSLETVLAEKGFVPIPRAISVARQLCEAISCGVDHGVPVGTLAPGDVWLDPEFTVKVKFFHEPGMPPPPVEHHAYQAPEILAGGDPGDPRSAVYTVGALLYHMLAATPPLAGATREEFARRARHDTPPPLKRTNIKVSPMLARVVESAMAKEPERRPKGVRALSRELQRSLAPGI
jgi:pSer/pThr/pTyr-binding forkhead associated (FHA) protein